MVQYVSSENSCEAVDAKVDIVVTTKPSMEAATIHGYPNKFTLQVKAMDDGMEAVVRGYGGGDHDGSHAGCSTYVHNAINDS